VVKRTITLAVAVAALALAGTATAATPAFQLGVSYPDFVVRSQQHRFDPPRINRLLVTNLGRPGFGAIGTTPQFSTPMFWTPDGRALVVAAADVRVRCVGVSPLCSYLTGAINESGDRATQWVPSPDGRRLAYVESRPATDGGTQSSPDASWLVVRPRTGPARDVVSEVSGPIAWLGDSRRVVHLSNGRLEVIDVVTGTRRTLASDACGSWDAGWGRPDGLLAAAPVGDRLAYTACRGATSAASEVHLVLLRADGRVIGRRRVTDGGASMLSRVPDASALTYRNWADARHVVRTVRADGRAERRQLLTTMEQVGVKPYDYSYMPWDPAWIGWRPCPSRGAACMRDVAPSCAGLARVTMPTISRCTMRHDGSLDLTLRAARDGEDYAQILPSVRGDLVKGSRSSDDIHGLAGNDVIRANAGDDDIDGGPGRDTILAGPGADRIVVRSQERDVVWCGAGRDIVLADRRDVVHDCEVVERYEEYVRTR
jgi:hypothetical protein